MRKLLSMTCFTAFCLAKGAPALAVGPSFDCGKANTPLAQFICSDPYLSRTDLLFVQPYYALRQMVGPTGWQSLKQEAATFQAAIQRECNVLPSNGLPPNRDVLTACIQNAYVRQMTAWRNRLSGPLLEEAVRPIEQHIALQAKLQEMGYLPSTETIDGVYGVSTRTAIQNWQSSSGLQATGFVGDEDARRLMGTAAGTPAPTSQPLLSQTNVERSSPRSVQQVPPLPAPIPSMDIVDFLVDGRDFVGRRVTVTGCEFKHADMDTITCAASGGRMYLDSPSLERESLRRSLRNCVGLGNHGPGCMGDVTGM